MRFDCLGGLQHARLAHFAPFPSTVSVFATDTDSLASTDCIHDLKQLTERPVFDQVRLASLVNLPNDFCF